jgi:peptidoglycan hydrolase-like protein with peptidoglycan-binding domain
MDKMSASFKDVLNTEANMKNFVAFENAMKANPEGFLKPGSTDVSKVNDLQKKLKLTGMNIVVNGNFGDATEKAVISFKKSVGINDGYSKQKWGLCCYRYSYT